MPPREYSVKSNNQTLKPKKKEIDLKTVTAICEELLNKGYVDAVKEILKTVNN